MKHILSTCVARWGNSSLTHWPHSPCCFQSHLGAKTFSETIRADEARQVEGQRLALILHEARFAVEGVHLRDASVHEEKDDALGSRAEVRLPHKGSVQSLCSGEGEVAEATGGGLEELAAVELHSR